MVDSSEIKKKRISFLYPESEVRKLESDIELLRKNVGLCDAPMTMELIRRIEKNPTATIDDSVTVSTMIQRFKLHCKCKPYPRKDILFI